MSTNWRISSFNGALLAAYFIPTWTIVAFKIMVSPIHGFYERPNISVALFVSDHLHLAGDGDRSLRLAAGARPDDRGRVLRDLPGFITRPSIRKSRRLR